MAAGSGVQPSAHVVTVSQLPMMQPRTAENQKE
jgi:hypothetical protein